MEEPKVVEPQPVQQEIKIVKKGLIYFIFNGIVWIFKIIYLMFRFAFTNIITNGKILNDYINKRNKVKKIHMAMYDKNDEEII